MKLWTYYYARTKDLPSNILPISIAGWGPSGWKFPEYKKLAPKKDWFWEFKKTGDTEFYKKKYKETVLDLLTPGEVCKDLYEILEKTNKELGTEYKDVALCCYEKSEDFCHRHLVASWFSGRGFGVCEEFSKKIYAIHKYMDKIKSYEETLCKLDQEFHNYPRFKPQENGYYLTIRINPRKIYTMVNYWTNNAWQVEVTDASETVAFSKDRLVELEEYGKNLETGD